MPRFELEVAWPQPRRQLVTVFAGSLEDAWVNREALIRARPLEPVIGEPRVVSVAAVPPPDAEAATPEGGETDGR